MKIPRKPKVTIIIVTYNSSVYIPQLFQSLSLQTYTGEMGVVVIDNNSQDNTKALLETHKKTVLVVPQRENTGFSGGVTIGIDIALKQGSDAVVLLNPDTFVAPTFLEELVRGAYSATDIATAQALLLLKNDPDIINTAGNSVHYLGFGYGDKYGEPLSAVPANTVMECTYGSGAALLIKREMIEYYGTLMSDYFMYHEDLEYGMRMRLAGMRNVVVTSAHVYHDYTFEKSIKKFYYMERNRHRYVLTHYSVKTLILIFPIYIITELALLIMSVIVKTTKERLRVWAYFLKKSTWEKLKRERCMVQGVRSISDSEIAKYFRDGVYFQEVDTWFAKYVANPTWRFYWKVIRGFV